MYSMLEMFECTFVLELALSDEQYRLVTLFCISYSIPTMLDKICTPNQSLAADGFLNLISSTSSIVG